MRTITLLLLLLAGLIAAVTTAPIPSPDAHHGGPHLEEEEGLTWVSQARMKSSKPMMHQKSGHHNMSRKKANMRKQEGVMMKKANMNNKNNKNKMKSNNKRRKNSNMNKRKQQTAAYKAKPAEQQQPMSFAERLMAMRQQQRKEQDAQRKRERDEYLAILKETGEIEEDADVIKYGAASTEYNPFKEEKREQQKLLKQQSVALPPETPPGPGGLMIQEDDDDDYNPFDVEEDNAYDKYTREQVEKELELVESEMERRRSEAERKKEAVRERLRDREALKWNTGSQLSRNRANQRMDTGEDSDPKARFRFVKDLNLAGRVRQREHQEKKTHMKMNPLNPQFKARHQSNIAAWRSRMRI